MSAWGLTRQTAGCRSCRSRTTYATPGMAVPHREGGSPADRLHRSHPAISFRKKRASTERGKADVTWVGPPPATRSASNQQEEPASKLGLAAGETLLLLAARFPQPGDALIWCPTLRQRRLKTAAPAPGACGVISAGAARRIRSPRCRLLRQAAVRGEVVPPQRRPPAPVLSAAPPPRPDKSGL